LHIAFDEGVEGEGQQADETQGHDFIVSMHIQGADRQVTLEVAHATLDVAMVVIDADHPVHEGHWGLTTLQRLVGDQDPLAIQTCGLGNPFG
jgi:hypothetical protein